MKGFLKNKRGKREMQSDENAKLFFPRKEEPLSVFRIIGKGIIGRLQFPITLVLNYRSNDIRIRPPQTNSEALVHG